MEGGFEDFGRALQSLVDEAMIVNWLLDDARSENNERTEEPRSLAKHKILDLCVLTSLSLTMTCKKNLLASGREIT